MKWVCITEADFYAEEAKDICRLCADEHVFRVHIRKPNATKEEFYHLLNQLSTSCFEKISVHDYFEAVDDFPIRVAPDNIISKNLFPLLNISLRVCFQNG